METTWKAGLEDVIAARSAITAIDGAKGRLYHRGYEIGDLAARASFEETTYLLWFGELPSPAERRGVRGPAARGARGPGARPRPPPHAPAGRASARRPAHRRLARGDGRSRRPRRRRRGEPPQGVPPHRAGPRGGRRLAAAPHGAGARWPPATRARTPPTSSGSSTAARPRRRSPTSSTRSSRSTPTTSSTPRRSRCGSRSPRWRTSTRPSRPRSPPSRGRATAAPTRTCWRCCSRSATPGGPRPTSPRAWTPTRAAPGGSGRTRGPAIPGFGHRVYRVDDARARVLRQMAKTMAEATGHARLFEIAERVYAAVTARTSLPVNVDFFSAVVYHALGIPGDLCTSIFAVGRVGRLVRARPRAVRGQPPDPAAGRLRGRAAAGDPRRRALTRARRRSGTRPGASGGASAGGSFAKKARTPSRASSVRKTASRERQRPADRLVLGRVLGEVRGLLDELERAIRPLGQRARELEGRGQRLAGRDHAVHEPPAARGLGVDRVAR